MPQVANTHHWQQPAGISGADPMLETVGGGESPVFLTARKSWRVGAPGIRRETGGGRLYGVAVRVVGAVLTLGRSAHDAAGRLRQGGEAELKHWRLAFGAPGRAPFGRRKLVRG